MKSLSTLNAGKKIPGEAELSSVNRFKCRHLRSTGKTCSMEGPFSQRRVKSVLFSAGSNLAKSSRARESTRIQSISTWRQLLTICEEVSGAVAILEAIIVTSIRSLELSK